MTDRHAGYIVTLKHDIREDDAEVTLAALRQIRGVLSVEPIMSDVSTHIGEMRGVTKAKEAIWNALRDL